MKKGWLERMKAVKSEKGFTLVELLATIVILGIIAAIAVPSIGALIENTKTKAHNANVEQVEEAARLKVLTEGAPASDTTYDVADLVSDYLNEVPTDPRANNGSYTTATVTITTDGSVTVNLN